MKKQSFINFLFVLLVIALALNAVILNLRISSLSKEVNELASDSRIPTPKILDR